MKMPSCGRTMLVIAAIAAGCASPAAQRSSTLATLQHELGEVRRGEVETPDHLPPLEPLVGAHRNQLRAALGSPRVCELPLEPPCEEIGEQLWLLHAEEVTGPVLVVELDGDRVRDARWRLPAAGPIDEDIGGPSTAPTPGVETPSSPTAIGHR